MNVRNRARFGRAVGAPALESEERQYVDVPAYDGGSQDVLKRREIVRDDAHHVTEYDYKASLYADYHNPWRVRESGPELSRVTGRQFLHAWPPYSAYLAAVVAAETTIVGADVPENRFAKSATFDLSTGFKTSETVYGVTTTYVPDSVGNVGTVTNGNGHTRTYTYEWGVPKTVATSEPAYGIARVINSDGTVHAETRTGRTTTFTYDGLFRPQMVTPPGSTNATTTSYDNIDGSWVEVTRGGSRVRTTHDGFGRVVQTDNSIGVRRLTEYDAEGRTIKESLPFATTGTLATARKDTVIEYDALGRVTRRVNPDGTDSLQSYGPNTVTLQSEPVDGARRVTVQTYESFGNPDEARLVKVRDAKGNDWVYTYNGLGQLRIVTAPDGAQRVWTYKTYTDADGEKATNRLASETHPESGTVTYVRYDAAGNLAEKRDANGKVFTYTYDGNERLATISVDGQPATSVTYEPGSDNRASVTRDGVTTTFRYDMAGRLDQRTDTVGAQAFTTTLHYDTNDNVTGVTYPTGRELTYGLDFEGRITSVTEGTRTYANGFEYHPSGAVRRFVAGNGLATTTDFDPNRYWVTHIQSGPLDLRYDDYDGVGNVTHITDARPDWTQAFAYDALDRLTSASSPRWSATYAYDAHGNRTGGNGATYTYGGATLRLDTFNGRTFTYDDNGNLMGSTGGPTFTYTPFNLVSSATSPAGVRTEYTYDADDWRVKKGTGSDVTFFLRGPTGELLTEWKNPGATTGQTVRDYIYAGSRLLAAVSKP